MKNINYIEQGLTEVNHLENQNSVGQQQHWSHQQSGANESSFNSKLWEHKPS